MTKGGHLVQYPWWTISDRAWYRNEEGRFRHYIIYQSNLFTDIWYLNFWTHNMTGRIWRPNTTTRAGGWKEGTKDRSARIEKAKKGQPGRAASLGQDWQDEIVRIEQLEQNNQNRTIRRGLPWQTGQPGYGNRDRAAKRDRLVKRGQPEKDCHDKTARSRQPKE
jgi:hypothetical protein